MKTLMTPQGRILTPSILLGTIIWAAFLLTASAQPTNCAPVPPGLAGWWAGDGSAQDNLGGSNGVLYGGMGFAAGKVGHAFSFDGSSGYVAMPASASLDVGAGAGLTVECWIKPAALADAQPVAEWNSGTHAGLHLWISQPPPYGGGSGSIYVNLIDTAGTFHTLTTGGGILNTNSFQHVALSYDKTSGMASLYCNGALVAAGMLGSFTPQTSVGLYLGKRVSDASFAAFHGLMDEVSLYSRALAAAEIQAIYNADGAGKCSLGTAPTITAQPAGQVVLAGASATFSVVAAGSSPLSYQWRLNGANLSGANGTALTLTNVQLAQGGNYTVQVTNLYGSATSSNAVLTVNPLLSCAPPPSGLVSWWAAESNALDSVGTNNGVLFPGAGFGAGMVGQAFSFNGITQCVTVPYSRSLAATNYSVEAWVKPLAQVNDPLNQKQLIGQAYGWELVARPGTSGINVAFQFATSKSSFYSVASTSELPIGQFSHVVGSWDGTTLRLYINGVLNAQKVVAATPVDLGYDIYIGGSYSVAGGFAGQYFNGLIDEASYYSRALSAAEIQAVYNAGSAGKCQTPVPPSIQAATQNQAVPPGGTVSFVVIAAGTSPLSYQWHFNGAGIAGATSSVLTLTNVQLASVGTYDVTVTNLYGTAHSAGATLTLIGSGACTPPPAGLVSWWKAEGTAADAVGTNNGALFPGAGFAAGMVGQAFSFNGTTQCVTVPYSRSLAATNYSVEAWVKPLAQVSDPLNQKQLIGQAYGWELVARPGTSGISVAFQFATSKGSFYSVAGTTELPIGQFSHVVGSWDGTTLRLYINGVLNAQKVVVATPVDLGYDIYIGGSYSVAGGFAGQYFNGLIDEASYYNRALSAAEIQTLYTAGSAGKCQTPVPPSIQASPQSQTVVLGTNASFRVVAGGPSPLSFQWHINGTDIAGATSSVLTLTNVQLASAGTYDVTVTNLYGVTNSSGATLTVLIPPAITGQPQDQTVGVGSNAMFSVAATGSGALSYQWYFNGTALSGATSTSLVLSGVSLSQAGSYGVTVSNVLGSANSRSALLVVLQNGACAPPPAGLVSWWKAEGSVADAVGTNNGVLFPGAAFGAGEVGQAFSFNGATQCVTVPYSRSLAATNYSVEAWVKPLSQVSDPLNQDQIIGQAYGWQLVARPGTSGIKVAFQFATSKDSFQSVASTSELPLGQFSHVVGSWDGTTLRLYINGVLNSQGVVAATPVDLGYDIYIGGSYSVAGGFAGQYFNGLIDEASYYNRALGAAEIQTLYTAGSAGKCQTPVPPSIQASPQNQAVPPGGTASYIVVAAGTSPLSYQWHFNGAGIAGATSSVLTLTNVQLGSVGTYDVTVTNLYGSTNSAGATLMLLGSGACTPPPAGLVSWWAAEGNALDSVGTNNGVLFPGAGFGAGEVGQAFSFNGTTQCVTVPYSRSLAATNYSVEAWVKPLAQVSDPLNQKQLIGQAYGWQLVARPGSSGISVAFQFATSKGSFQSVASTSELPLGQFSHVVGSWDGTTLRLYINGVLNAQKVVAATPVDLGYDIYIGGSYSVAGGFAGQYFNGLIDEASYYNRALSAAEIQAVYNAGSAGKCQTPVPPSIQAATQNQAIPPGGTVSFVVIAAGTSPLSYQWHFKGAGIAGATSSVLTLTNVQLGSVGTYDVTVTNLYGSANSAGATLTLLGNGMCTPPPVGLVSWWKAEGTAADAVGTNNGVLFPGAGFAGGMVGQAFSFNGTTQCVTVPYSRSLAATNYSVEAWVKPLTQVSDPLNQKQLIGQAYGWQLVARPGTSGISVAFQFATSKGSFYSVAGTTELPIGQFSHVAGTWDGTTLRLFINGVLNAQKVVAATPVDLGYDIYIGGSYSVAGGFAGQYFNGLIDEASYYSRALSGAEIQSICNAGSAGKCALGVAPSIITQPASLAVPAGATAAFSVTAAGTPPLGYQWCLGGINIAGATGTSLTLSNVQSAQAGSYAVRVTNTFGSIMSSNALLMVISSPPCATPPSGLVSWWRAEGTARDSVAGNHGTLLNGASFASGMVGQAFSFSGSNQCVQVPHAASLVGSNYSIEAWVKPLAQVSDPINQNLIFGQNFGLCQLVARTGSTGVRLAFSFGTSHTSFYEATGTSEIPIGQFSHLAGTWDGTTLRLYINGVLNAQSTPHASPMDSGCPFYIGGFYSPTADNCGYVGQFFNGLIDEASYYSRALSGAEIQSIYNAGGAGKCALGVAPSIITQPASQTVSAGATAAFTVTAAGTPPLSYQWQFSGTNIAGATGTSLTLSNVQSAQAGSYAVRVTNTFGSTMSSNALLTVILTPACVAPPSDLVSWWRGEGDGIASVGTNNISTLDGITFAAGEVGQGFSFDGGAHRVLVPDAPELNFGANQDFTIEAWIQPQVETTTYDVMSIVDKRFSSGGSDSPQGYEFCLGSGRVHGRFLSAGFGPAGPDLRDGKFHHIAWTLSRASTTGGNLYVDGSAVLTFDPTPYAGTLSNTQPLRLGNHADSTFTTFFKGVIDEVSIYRRALSPSEIAAVYSAGNAGKCPLGVAPSIITQPASQAVSAGAIAAFAVKAAGTPPLSYQWQFSGTNIAGATSSSLTLSNVQSAQAGSYAVRVTNTFGSIMSSNALLTVISSPPCATPPSGLVSWWRAEGTARDSVAGNHGTLLNGASFASGMVGQAFSFSGSNQCVQVPHAASLVGSNYSIEAWVKPLAQVSDPINQDLIFGQSFGYCQLVARTGSTGVRLAFSFGTSHTSFYEATGTSEIPIGQFSHLAGTWDGTTLRLYINGVLNAQSTPHASPVDSGCPFYIGGFYSPTADNCGYVGQFFNGLIDEASYYSRALSGAEIQTIYNAGGAGKCALARQVLPLRLQVSLNPDGTKRVQFVGNDSQSYRIEGSADLMKWVSLGTCAADAGGNVEFTDPDVARQPLRFYRAVEQ